MVQLDHHTQPPLCRLEISITFHIFLVKVNSSLNRKSTFNLSWCRAFIFSLELCNSDFVVFRFWICFFVAQSLDLIWVGLEIRSKGRNIFSSDNIYFFLIWSFMKYQGLETLRWNKCHGFFLWVWPSSSGWEVELSSNIGRYHPNFPMGWCTQRRFDFSFPYMQWKPFSISSFCITIVLQKGW